MDNDRLVKLLNLSSSNNEGEAISAIKKANSLLKESNSSWEDILKEKPETNKFDKIEYAILQRNLQKEISISRELKDELKFSKMILKYLGIFIIFLIIVIILK